MFKLLKMIKNLFKRDGYKKNIVADARARVAQTAMKQIISDMLAEENAIFERACRENAEPPLTEISIEILELNGIVMCQFSDDDGSRKWLEQRGTIISPVVVQKFKI